MILLLGCSEPPAPPAAEQRTPTTTAQPDLVLVLTAGLRADPPGVAAAEARFFAALPPAARRFEAAYAQSVSTLVSAGSVLTGLYPSSIPMCGLHRELDGRDDTSNVAWCADVPPQRYSLPEVLGLYGYATALVSSGYAGQELLADEFQSAVHLPRDGTATPWSDVARTASTWWTEHAAQPRLLVVLTADLRLGQRPDVRAQMGLGSTAVDRLTPVDPEAAEDPARVRELYANEAAAAGRGVADLLAALPAAPRETWAIVTSAHGISLTEQGGKTGPPIQTLGEDILLDRTLRVPLALYAPRPLDGPAVWTDPVELVDVFPTFAALAGAVPPSGLPGRDLRSAEPDPAAYAYAEFGDMVAVREGPWFLMFRCLVHYASSLDPEVTRRLVDRSPGAPRKINLYDVARDPFQEREVRDPKQHQALYEHMVQLRTTVAVPPPDTMTPQRLYEIRMARSNGYW